ncbi:MAG: tetratricopeptide repeat protein [Candidatus Obscuribacterales bacterium]|nr:tetratricopeptide repeat protein [Candidatus Obscuribacterales bacterium]
MRRISAGILIALLFAGPAFAKGSAWTDNIRQGRTCLQEGHYEEAAQLLKAALDDTRKFKDNDPRMGVTLHSMGDLYLRQGEYNLAKEYFERALSLEQKLQGAESLDVADDLYGLALCNQQLGDHLAAEIFLKRVDEIWRRKLGPNHPRLLSILPAEAAYASMKNNLAVAEACYRQIVAIKEKELGTNNPKIGSDLNLLATTLGNEGKMGEAKETATRAVSLLDSSNEPEIAKESAKDNLSVIESNQKIAMAEEKKMPVVPNVVSPPEQARNKETQAPAEQSNVATSGPWDNPEIKKKLDTVSIHHQGPSKLAKVRYLAEGRLITPSEYKAMLLASQAYEMMRQEKYHLAVDLLNKALDEFPNLSSAHTNLGLAFCRLGQNDLAVEHLQTAIAINPKRSAPWLNLASSFQNEGRLKDSVETYKEYLKRFPNDSLANKVRDLVTHLAQEVDEQSAVEKQLLAEGKNVNDYFAYTTQGGVHKWSEAKMPLKVCLESGNNVSGFRSEYNGLLQNAFRQWAAASRGHLRFEFVNHADDADIVCAWTNDATKVSSVTEGGETQLSSKGKEIERAKITILTLDPTPDSPLSQNQLKAVCLHEAGHAVGLIGHSPKPGDVMFCTMPPAETKVGISERDISTLGHLYEADLAAIPVSFNQ